MFSKNFKDLRKKNGFTQVSFAKKFKVANGTVGMWESGNRTPDVETMSRIADFFNVTIDRLLGRTPLTDEEMDKFVDDTVKHIIGRENGEDTDEKPAVFQDDGLSAKQQALIEVIKSMDVASVDAMTVAADALIARQEKEDH